MEPDAFEPNLKIERCCLRIFRYPNNHIRKFILLTIRNTGNEEALSCHARLSSNDTPQTEYPLHWAVTPYTPSRDHAEPIDILPKEPRDLDVAFSIGGTIPTIPTSDGISTSTTTTTSESFRTAGTLDPEYFAGTVWKSEDRSPVEGPRNPVVRIEGPRSGAWIALPLALTNPELAAQARLEPGQYHVEIEVFTINGNGDRCALTIISSLNWKELNFTSNLPTLKSS